MYFLFMGRLVKWIGILGNKIDQLFNTERVSEKESLPSEFNPVLDKIKSAFSQLKESKQTKIVAPDETEKLKELRKIIDNLYLVNELGQNVTSSLDLNESFQHLYTTINSMMDAAVLELYVYNEASGEPKLFTNIQHPDSVENSTYQNNLADWCFKNVREVFLTNAERDYARYVFQPLILPDGRIAKSVIAFPVLNRNAVTGTLCIISFQENTFNDYHREIIRLLLGYISVAIENAIRHEELNLTKIRAEKSEKFKEQFLANMSHEIRTPINAVTGMTGLLLEKQPRTDQLRYLESIRNASDSLLVIINDILDLSKIEAGKIEFEKVDISINDLIRNVFEIMHFKAEEKGLLLNKQIDKNIPPVLIGDPTRLTQILINLIGNAVKFTDKGSVEVNVHRIDNGSNEIVSNAIVSLNFSVVDTGIGMTEEQQQRLFQDYAQAGPETSRKYGGTGLGLSISRQLVQMKGGTITVKSVPGEGSTFAFNLNFPVSENKSIAIIEKNISGDMLAALRGIKILLADDNEYNRIVVRETLQLKIGNVSIDEASDGEMAIEMIRKNKYDLVLMDLVMPKLDGLEATRLIRKMQSPVKDIPVLALTASVVKSEMDKCYDAGMNGFVPKPFKNHELLGAIYKTLVKEDVVFEEVQVLKSTSKNEGAYVDMNYLHELTEGDEVRQKRYIELFFRKVPESISTLKVAYENRDIEQVRITAHSLKSLLSFAGVFAGLELAESIEQSCSVDGKLEDVPEKIERLSVICEGAIDELKANFTQLQPPDSK